jgi:Tfp pilus assembly protein PilP
MTWKLYAIVSAGAFVATYLMSSPKPESATTKASTAAPRSARQAAAETEIEALANSLQVHLKSDAVFRTPGRDPFRFQARVQKPPAFVPPPAVVENLPAPALPILSLTGIATDVVDGKAQRSAVVSLPAGVLIVREGESIAGLYTVVAISDDSIELESTGDSSRRTLRLSGR